MADGIKRIDIKEFQEEGYLQELNRQFLHPLGLALEVIIEDDGSMTLGGIWDYRDDPEGIAFGPGVIDEEKVNKVHRHQQNRMRARTEKLGYWVQSE